MPGRSPNGCTKGPIPSTCPINRSTRWPRTGRKVSKPPNKSQDIGRKCSTIPMAGAAVGPACSPGERGDHRIPRGATTHRPRRWTAWRPRRAYCSASAPPRAGRGPRRRERVGVRAAASGSGSAPTGAAFRAGSWSRLGNEGGRPGGPRPFLGRNRPTTSGLPRIARPIRGSSRTTSSCCRKPDGNRGGSGDRPARRCERRALCGKSQAKEHSKPPGSSPSLPIATSAQRGERSPAARTPTPAPARPTPPATARRACSPRCTR